MSPHKPALLIHTFLPAEAGSAGTTRAALATLWHGVDDLDAPVGRRSMDSTRLPDDLGSGRDALKVLAARRRAVPGALYEALVYRMHDVFGVAVLRAPNDDTIGWGTLDAQPSPALDGLLGTTTIYIGQWGRRWLGSRSADGLRRHLPGPNHTAWTRSIGRTPDGLQLWELPTDSPVHRRLLAMSDPHDEPVMDHWTWLSDGRILPPLTRYLVHATKLHYQEQVLDAAMPRLRAAVENTDRVCDTLVDLLRTQDPPVGQLLAASQALGTVQAEQGGLITASADVTDMAETVRAARRNMEAALPDSTAGGPFDKDRETAEWLGAQLRLERTYLESAQRKAGELARLCSALLDVRQRQRQEALTILHASILGGLIMALTAIQAFQYRLPLPHSITAPLIWTLVTTAALLPAAVLHWSHRRRSVLRLRFIAGSALLGANVGWLVLNASAEHPVAPVWSALAAAGGAVLCGGATTTLTRRGT